MELLNIKGRKFKVKELNQFKIKKKKHNIKYLKIKNTNLSWQICNENSQFISKEIKRICNNNESELSIKIYS